MKSLERRFNRISRRNPYWSTMTCFTETIYGVGFSRQSIHNWFNKLVDRDDYAREDKKSIMSFLESVGKHSRSIKNKGKLTLRDDFRTKTIN